MANKTIIEASEKSEIKVINPNFSIDNVVTIKIGKDEIHLGEEQAKELQEAMEKAMVDKCYWYEEMQRQQDELENRIEYLEEKLEYCGMEVDG